MPTAAMTAKAEPTWGDLHGHPGCHGCQMCWDCLLDPDSPEYVDITDEMLKLPPEGGSKEEEENIPF